MYLSRFGVKRYKCLGDIDIPLTPIHVLIGENDAGKTSLLEAMAAFMGSADSPLSDLFPEPWEGRELVLHGSPEGSVELSGTWDSPGIGDNVAASSQVAFTFRIQFHADKRRCTIDAASACVDGYPEYSAMSKELPTDHTPQWRWKQHQKLPKDVSSAQFDPVVKLLRPAQMFSFDPEYMSLPVTIATTPKFKLDRDGFGLPAVLMDILGNDAARFLKLREDFCRYFPQFRNIRIEREPGNQRQHTKGGTHGVQPGGTGWAIYFESHGGTAVRAGQASDGAILFLGFLALANVPEPPSLLLLEEPENGVYPKRLREIIALLKKIGSDGATDFPQIIMSTHSPYVLSFFEPEEVTFLSREPGRPDGPVRAKPLREAPNIKERLAGGEFYLGELWYNLSEEDLFGEP
jgi:predicted ATPase